MRRSAEPVGDRDPTVTGVRADDLSVLDLQHPPLPLYEVSELELSGPALTARIYRPGSGRLPLLVYFHGGGFVCDLAGYDRPLRQLAYATGCVIAAPQVRLAPEHPFPAALDDAISSYGRLADHQQKLGVTGPVGIAGDSSGGNLAAATTHALAHFDNAPAWQVLIYPMLDATASSPSYDSYAEGFGFTKRKSLWYFDQYLQGAVDPRDPRISPLFEPELSAVPPTFVATAECDPLRDEGELYADRLRRVDRTVEVHRYPRAEHGFFQQDRVAPHAAALRAAIASWVRARTAADRPS